jgi:arylamine N-acetyltransferase
MNTPYLKIPQVLVDRYLNLLGIQRQEPNFQALSELIEAQLYKVPFENISKLYYNLHRGSRDIPDLESYLDGIEHYHFGGTCYANNYYFSQLLANLGYQVIFCGAAMNKPDVHAVSMVTIDGQDYLIDVGYAAPFWMPIPLDLEKDYIIRLGSDRYVIKPKDTSGCSQLELYRNGELKHGYLARPFPRQIQDFEQVIFNSFRDEGVFMNALLLTKFSPKQSYVINNLTTIEYHGIEPTIRRLEDTDELVKIVNQWFNIPIEHIQDAINQLDSFEDPWD